MNIAEFLTAMKASNPKAFAKLNDVQVRQITATVIGEIGKLIDNAAEDKLAVVPSLGRFRIKMVPSKEDPNVKTRRVVFIRANARPAAKGPRVK